MHTPNREEQALAEVGRTAVGRGTALVLVGLFFVTIAALSLIQGVFDWRRAEEGAGAIDRFSPALGLLVERAAEAMPEPGDRSFGGLAEANRALLSAMGAAETELEEGSILRDGLLPRLQWVQAALLSVGNEQAYLGRDGWLFYRADLDYVLGPGFLEPGMLRRRARGGDVTEDAPSPDPRPALVSFGERLARRGIRLVVMPTPVKPSIHPERFSRRVGSTSAPVENPSFDRFVADLAAVGVPVFDPGPILAGAARDGREQFLATDTHWTPGAVELVARELAVTIRERLPESGLRHGYSSREVVVDGRGDIAAMLRLPQGSELFLAERVRLRTILEPDGRSWRPPATAEVLLLGDSFTNVFSDPELGWGSGAGLAEQLSFELDRPVARLALNAGGAVASRRALEREARSGQDRLERATVVVYQFATRELAQGSWPVLEEATASAR